MTPYSIHYFIIAVLGFVLAIPSNTCIVIVSLENLRKNVKLSPPDVIFMAKGMVNLLLQSCMTLRITIAVFSVSYIMEGFLFMTVLAYFLTYFSFWMTVWLSAHYCTIITNLSTGFFIWIKRIVSNYLNRILLLTALGIFLVNVLNVWAVNQQHVYQSSGNSTRALLSYYINYPCFVPVIILGGILPFCLSLLCLFLTFFFLVRHVWRVKSNDSGSSRPNLQAHVSTLRTIFYLLLMSTSFSMPQVMVILMKSPEYVYQIHMASWVLRLLCPSFEAAVIFQANKKLRRAIVRKFWVWRNIET